MTAASGLTIRVAAEVMVDCPKTLPHDASIAAAREVLEDPHVHMVLLTRGKRLVGTIVRADIPAHALGQASASHVAVLADRTVSPSEPIAAIRARMIDAGARRLAVVDDGHRLLGLLCLKRDRWGFCSTEGVRARAAETSSRSS